MLKVRATTPTRIDLAGGTLDLWPIPHLLDHKATVNVGVTLMARAEVALSPDDKCHIVSRDQQAQISGTFREIIGPTTLPLLSLIIGTLWDSRLPPLTLTTAAESPAGAGLGGSSCLAIAVAGALARARHVLEGRAEPAEAQLVQLVQDIEARVIQVPTGIQDYWGGLRGGLNILHHPFGGPQVETISSGVLTHIEDELILCYSGRSRASAINNWEIFKRLFDGDRELKATFNAIGRAAEGCAAAAREGDYSRLVAQSKEEWRLRTHLWPAIETEETRRIDHAALSHGARLTRVCGAGGGGVMAVLAPRAARNDVAAAMTSAGGTVLPAGVATTGLTIDAG